MLMKSGLSSVCAFCSASASPGIPVDRVVGMLEKVRACFVDQAIGHCTG